MPPSSLRPCLCPRTSGTRPPCAPRIWGRGRRSIPGTPGTHSPRGHAAPSTRYAQCSPSSSGCELCSSAPLIKNESQRVHRTVSPSRGSAYPSNEPSQPLATRLALVQPARLELPLLDPQVARSEVARSSSSRSATRPSRRLSLVLSLGSPAWRCPETNARDDPPVWAAFGVSRHLQATYAKALPCRRSRVRAPSSALLNPRKSGGFVVLEVNA